ncbi:tyrosine-protein phosphatase [Liquorilactobacillus sicerae]|uniref:tyrosine-protein phosphatase n=1 Tax=Liquorilactobacillus sicerae TaxID=1416943 RepID=UPI0024813845|nr:tyrosine-protein phosphatase [Liquorilactobacillus sicerae]
MNQQQNFSQVKITNLRDIGGYRTSAGQLKTGIFFRSGELYNLSKEATDFLSHELAIKKIFDFRRPTEIENRPDSKIAQATYENISLLSTPAQANPSLKNMVINPHMENYMFKVYAELVLSKSAQQGLHNFLLEALSLHKPLLFHCFAGKDRTGLAAAFLLKIAGVADDDIFDDYLKTNQARQKANQEILNYFANKLSPEKLKELEISLSVKAEYLKHAFDQITENFGNFDNYLVNGLNLPADYQAKFQATYLE